MGLHYGVLGSHRDALGYLQVALSMAPMEGFPKFFVPMFQVLRIRVCAVSQGLGLRAVLHTRKPTFTMSTRSPKNH